MRRRDRQGEKEEMDCKGADAKNVVPLYLTEPLIPFT